MITAILPSRNEPYLQKTIDSLLENAKGEIEMKYMTAKEEDILTNASYIKQGIVIDKLLQSLIVTKVDYNDLLVGDKNALMIAARILAYGAKAEVKKEEIAPEAPAEETPAEETPSEETPPTT